MHYNTGQEKRARLVRNMENMRVKHLVSFLLFLSLTRICTPSPTPDANQKHFVLVHGAGHGAWCWYKVSTLLTSIGHNVTALDLAASGVNPKQVQQLHSLSDYVEPLMRFMKSLPPKERVILVGHSMGGAAISIAMEKFPGMIYTAVFATAVMPGPTLDYLNLSSQILNSLDLMDSQFRYDRGPNNPPTATLIGPKLLSSSFYQLSPPEDLTLALSLVRFSPLFSDDIKLTIEKYGSVRRVFIGCDQDHIVTEKWRMLMINKNPPNEVKLINGSDHMVMFSRPLELFSYLKEVAES
ncbi:unnamed protein product [Prunus brigantina]